MITGRLVRHVVVVFGVVDVVVVVTAAVVDVSLLLLEEESCSFAFCSSSPVPFPLLASRVARTATMTTTAIPVKLATNLNRR